MEKRDYRLDRTNEPSLMQTLLFSYHRRLNLYLRKKRSCIILRKERREVKRKNLREQKQRDNPDAAIFMNEKNRKFIEKILKDSMDTNLLTSSMNSIELTDKSDKNSIEEESKIMKRLMKLGFLEKDVHNAFENSRATFDDAIDWLCLNVDENNLPKQFAAKGKQLDVVHLGTNNIFKSNRKSVGKFEGSLQEEFLFKYGFQIDDIKTYLKQSNNDHIRALLALYNDRISELQILPEVENPEDDNKMDKEEEDLVEEEAMVLESMFDSAFEMDRRPSSDLVQAIMSIKLKGIGKSQTTNCLLEMYIPMGLKYPESCPIILLSADSWTSDQSLRIQKALAKKVTENLKGELIMYECSLWAQSSALGDHLKQLTDETKSKKLSHTDNIVTDPKKSEAKVVASSSVKRKRDVGRRRYQQKKNVK